LIAHYKLTVGPFRIELLESRGYNSPRFTMLFGILAQPKAVALIYLGEDRLAALASFARKVEYHQTTGEA
jgi:hypothetical protein